MGKFYQQTILAYKHKKLSLLFNSFIVVKFYAFSLRCWSDGRTKILYSWESYQTTLEFCALNIMNLSVKILHVRSCTRFLKEIVTDKKILSCLVTFVTFQALSSLRHLFS